MTNPYKLLDPEKAKRLAELTAVENPTALEGEIAMLRLLAEEALNAQGMEYSPSFAALCFKIIGHLSSATETAKFKRGELLCKAAVLQIANQVAQLWADAVAGRFDGWETVIDDVQQKVLTVVSSAENPDPRNIS